MHKRFHVYSRLWIWYFYMKQEHPHVDLEEMLFFNTILPPQIKDKIILGGLSEILTSTQMPVISNNARQMFFSICAK